MSNVWATFSDGTAVPMDGKFHVDPSCPQSSVKYLEPWHPPEVLEVLYGGNTARIGSLLDGKILKYVFDRDDPWAAKCLDIEHQILLALGEHERLVRYYGRQKHGLVFQFEINGDLRHYFSKKGFGNIPIQQRERWVKQVVESIEFIHSKHVIHCDLQPNNLLVDDECNLRLCDFAGSLLGKLDGKAMESTRFFLPRDPLSIPNTKSDLFALGSIIYYIMMGYEPYEDLSDDEVTTKFTRGEFPNVDGLKFGRTISGCWTVKFGTAGEVLATLAED